MPEREPATAELTERSLPSQRMDAAAERLKVEKPEPAPAEKAKRTKSPAYIVLRADGDRFERLTPEPIAASSRKDAISKAAPPELAGELPPAPEQFVTILEDAWVEHTRNLKPPDPSAYVETWS